MTVENKIDELRVLIDKVKEHSDALDVNDRISVLELSVIISKITKLHETALILKYLAKREHGVTISQCKEIEEESSNETNKDHVILSSAESVLVEESQVDEADEDAIEAMVEGMKEEIQVELNLEEEIGETDELLIQEDAQKEDTPIEELIESTLESNTVQAEEVKEEIIPDIPEVNELSTDFFDEILGKEEAPISINDIESKEEFSGSPDLNERFSGKNDESVGGHLQKQPISDLISSIGLNERYLYSSELFDGEMTDFKRSIQLLNDFDTGEEAKAFFNNELRPSYGWEQDLSLIHI